MATNPTFDAAKEKFNKLRSNFTPGQMTVGGLLAATLIGGSAMFYNWASAPQYEVLFTNLADKDASAVVEQLKTDGVEYKLEQGGSAVLVPAGKVDAERLALASKDLPKGSTVGYELLDDQSMTTSSYMEQVNTQRALEGELARTLSSIDGVSSAQVHLVMSQEKLFSSEDSAARASVLLTTNDDLDDDKVSSITHLVASSVANLDPKNVSVTDQNGRVLGDNGAAGTSTSQLKLTNAVSEDLTVKANSMLAQVLGPNKAVVRVNADLDFDQHKQKSETYDPSRQAITHETKTGEDYTGADADAQGPVTTDTTTNTGSGSSSSSYNKSSTDTTYGVSRIVSDDTSTPGQIKRLTAAVVLDSTAAKGTDTKQVESLIAAAIGLDSSRGDQIVVNTATFDTSGQDDANKAADAAAKARSKAQTMHMVETGGGIAVLLLVGGVLLWVIRRPKSKDLDWSPESLQALSAGLPVSGTVTEPTPERVSNADADVEPTHLSPTERMLRRVDRHPEKVVSVLRSWMAEDDQK
jgi:flagellar M-ring protein FliF